MFIKVYIVYYEMMVQGNNYKLWTILNVKRKYRRTKSSKQNCMRAAENSET